MAAGTGKQNSRSVGGRDQVKVGTKTSLDWTSFDRVGTLRLGLIIKLKQQSKLAKNSCLKNGELAFVLFKVLVLKS